MEKRLPTLITYRAAEEMQKAGIRYGVLLVIKNIAMFACIATAMGFTYYMATLSLHEAPNWMPFASILCTGVAIVSFKLIGNMMCDGSFHPRLSFEELEAMKNQMGLLPEVFEQTNQAVLHGSKEDHQMMKEQCVDCPATAK